MIGVLEAQLQAIVSGRHVVRGSGRGPNLVVRPASTDEVSQCLAVLRSHAQPVVALGGLTGLVGGTDAPSSFVGLSTERLNSVESFDSERRQILVGAGVKLEQVHDFADAHRLRYGVDLGARGSCTIGGNIATNAGGNSVVRFGMTRANIAGLEVVLSDGSVLSDLGGLAKNNAGYDLKQLFVGSEGTLGIITRALLKLNRPSSGTSSALLAVESFEDALVVTSALEAGCGDALLALEIMWNRYFTTVGPVVMKGGPLPLSDKHPFYLLAQVEGRDRGASSEEMLLDALGGAECIADSAYARTSAQEKLFWAIRDGSELVERLHRSVISFDVSMRPRDYASYVCEIEATLHRRLPGAITYCFGHLADGNVHFMIGHDEPAMDTQLLIEECVYEPLARYRPSSISAEHGIGREKAGHLWRSRSAPEIAAMNAIRAALDPAAILNPHIRYEPAPRAAGDRL